MRFFHLADLHIGKMVNGYSMIDDQRVLLDQVLDHLRKERPDGLILAGDIYDRRNPSVEAIALFDAFISQVILDLGIPVLAIGGNHDGGERLGFANGIQAKAGLHLVGNFTWPIPKVRLEKNGEVVDIYLMAYADLAVLHALVPETAGMNYPEAMDWILSHTALDPSVINVLVAHGVVTGDAPLIESDSERVLSIGGTEYWQSSSLKAFDYVALGHLHRAQKSGSTRIRYAGSLMQYSFSEEKHHKVMLDVHLGASGEFDVQEIPLEAPHHFVTIKGMFDALLAVPEAARVHKEDYLRVILEDQGSLLEPMQRLKGVYPNIMLLERAAQAAGTVSDKLVSSAQGARKMQPQALFAQFFEQVTGEEPTEKMTAIVGEIFQDVQKEGV
ncbi:MAG: exonuclease SbcCD subunit D [Peptococcaceae bacterium]|nr:exonuclease SbcCD subunit D [Peptococcaceae bacterium]